MLRSAVLRRALSPIRQSRHTFSPFCPFSRTHSTDNGPITPIHARYADKLKEKATKQGVSLEELITTADADKVREADVAELKKQGEMFRKRAKEVQEIPETAPNAAQIPKSKPLTMELDSFIDVAKFEPHSTNEIEMLWKARFLNTPNAFSGTMNIDAFSKLYINARKYSTFVLPLPHEEHGIELHYVQWSFVSSETIYCLITSLAQYKLHGEYAHPHTTFMLHTNFAADKRIVLSNSVIQGNEIPTENSALLVLNLQRFYTAEPTNEHGKVKADLLRQFNTGDTSFSVDKLIEATETLD